MIITALLILTNLDRIFQSFILDKLPGYGANCTKFEDIDSIKNQLKKII